eukprot:4534297-Pleurochrysis_carterae.AAC.1
MSAVFAMLRCCLWACASIEPCAFKECEVPPGLASSDFNWVVANHGRVKSLALHWGQFGVSCQPGRSCNAEARASVDFDWEGICSTVG